MGCNASKARIHTEPLTVGEPKTRLVARRPSIRVTVGAAMRRYGSSGGGKWTATESTTHPDTKDPNVQRVMKICGF